ncbi:DUF3597 domain-containing protein [Rhizobium sp. PL01]|uniref:DUF3597 domain-containing protein n=1 Tax=Rhizobium sp. PL01 TaxID=3085631 RepID=UPI00298120E2|nr:DUF3597 domain-containing protein [Rhizobium sp. PL01]MDW5318478.1 DUF3597 domain-containing protein [Rhizobium sp. PL01]
MGIFDKIKHAIFGDDHGKNESVAASVTPITAGTTTPMSTAPVIVADAQPTGAGIAEQRVDTPVFEPRAAQQVDVTALLDSKAAASGQTLHWRNSVVDLMKALGMEASLIERKELADELGFVGDKNDSATMNIWLHKALMKKLAENGGTIPADILD